MPEVLINGTPTGKQLFNQIIMILLDDLDEVYEANTPQAEKNIEVVILAIVGLSQRRCSDLWMFHGCKKHCMEIILYKRSLSLYS